MAIQRSYLPRKFCSGIQEQDLTQSLTVILKNKYNLHLVKATQSLYPSLANDYESRMLKLSKGSPVLIAERTSYLPSNQPAEFLKSLSRGDRYKFVVQLRRE
jgi:GntR family transcriptional regulator